MPPEPYWDPDRDGTLTEKTMPPEHGTLTEKTMPPEPGTLTEKTMPPEPYWEPDCYRQRKLSPPPDVNGRRFVAPSERNEY
ncbi:hypothetical protein BgiMline_001052 [Biomphalaria glabrata]|nr:hypothetical protein BgiMline_000977 [Biomphalaria glabrata]